MLFAVAVVWSARSKGLSEYVPVDWTGVDQQEQVATIRRLHDDCGRARVCGEDPSSGACLRSGLHE